MSLGVNLSSKLKQFRAKAGKTQQELANLTGLSRATINRWEKKGAGTATLDEVESLSERMRVPVADFFGMRNPVTLWSAAEPSRRSSDNRVSPARQRLIEIINHCDDKQVSVILHAFEILTEKTEESPSEEL